MDSGTVETTTTAQQQQQSQSNASKKRKLETAAVAIETPVPSSPSSSSSFSSSSSPSVMAVIAGNGIASNASVGASPAKKQKEKLSLHDWSKDIMKYVVVTGGVLSGLGKGIMASSIGAILKAAGYRVTAIKIDPYLNTDAGTMSPYEHGEVFVLDDGGEADLDLGNYERFMDLSLGRDNNITTGKVFQLVIQKERRGDYLGKTVQVIPHVTDEIQAWIRRVAQTPSENTDSTTTTSISANANANANANSTTASADSRKQAAQVCVIELGGTIGDIESMPFVEALRQFQLRVGRDSLCLVHVSLIPLVGGSLKTKPTQHSVKELRALGLSPDIIACRCDVPVDESVREKLALHCHVDAENVLSVHNVTNLYRVPALIEKQGILDFLRSRLKLSSTNISNGAVSTRFWNEFADRYDNVKDEVTIAVVGKYTQFHDSYLSVVKALEFAAVRAGRKLKINWVEATDLAGDADDDGGDGGGSETPVENGTSKVPSPSNRPEFKEAWRTVRSSDGILVPGGFGDRGVEGMVAAAGWARRSGIPYLGVCLGFQIAVIEFARSTLGWTDANSQEFNAKSTHTVLIYMPEVSKTEMGGTMRLGSRTVKLSPDSLMFKMYGNASTIQERHRHRYEVNPEFIPKIEERGMKFVGHDETDTRMEVMELPGHPYFVGCQYHPEFKARPLRPSPPFLGLILAASGQLREFLATHSAQQ